MSKTTRYLFVILNFVIGILVVLVMIMTLIQRNEINTLRRELASCSQERLNCINQLGVFYVDPDKRLAKRGKNGG